jgi:integrase
MGVEQKPGSSVSPVCPRAGFGAQVMLKAFTDTLLRSIDPPVTGRIEVVDLRCTGLAFRVTTGGSRSWCFRFRDPRSGKPLRITLGLYPDVSLTQARERADKLREQVANGINPIEQERKAATTRNFDALADRYLVEHARRKKRSADADERNLKLHVLPGWEDRRFDEITRADIVELVEGLVSAGTPTLANRVQALVSSVFSFAMDAGLVTGNPCAGLRRRGVERIGRRILSDDEIRLFWPAVIEKPVSPRVGLALRLMLLTAVRPGEAAGLARSELAHLKQKERAQWIIAKERSKNGRPHLVPLSEPAREVVLEALKLADNEIDHVFPSPSVKDAAITAHALAVAMARFAVSLDDKVAKTWVDDPPTPHDLRRTVATRLAALAVVKEDRDAILNHAPQGVGKKHYDLYERAKEKRAALDRWARSFVRILKQRPVKRASLP